MKHCYFDCIMKFVDLLCVKFIAKQSSKYASSKNIDFACTEDDCLLGGMFDSGYCSLKYKIAMEWRSRYTEYFS